ncbi:MAG: hypothetical protein IJA90_02960 [Peptococcaceae bacterium]|nr:hypothetical protein [Peptococcaceae bacterium]
MNERNYKTIAIVLAIMLIFNSWQIFQIKQELADLTYDYNHTLNSIKYDIGIIENISEHQYSRVESLLTEQASLFSKTDVTMKLAGNQIAVTMNAVPKELQNDETLIARITANGIIYNQPADKNGSATLLVEPAEIMQPSFVIQSSSGIRQEVLSEISLWSYITSYVQTSWDHQQEATERKLILDLYLEDMAEQPFTADEIAEAKCIVIDVHSNGTPEAAVPESAAVRIDKPDQFSNFSQIPQGDEIIAVKQTDSTADTVHYQADFSEYYQHYQSHGSISYQVHFILTTKDGIVFTSKLNPVAEFNSYSGSRTAGREQLFPVF